MKKKYFNLLVLTFFSLLIFSCVDRGNQEPVRLLELYVVDTLGLPVPNAKIDFYLKEEDLRQDKNQILEPFYSDEEGRIQVALDFEIFDYFANIEKGDLNNWYTTTIIKVPETTQKNISTVTIQNSIQAQITGRDKKRWQQTANIINGNPSGLNCTNQLYHDFTRRSDVNIYQVEIDGIIDKFQSDACSTPEKPAGFNIWKYDRENNTMTLGVDTFEEVYKFENFTGSEFSIVLTTLNGAFIIERKFKLVQ
ncbi:hypothetical protein WAF17_21295 [Bernardetia sp. ABR2-2B]|uniref:hypothetical protein n=1 Tax=Bernardetia sp. ABR2-2B TaxID=3127472 RepID=UPI0030D34391